MQPTGKSTPVGMVEILVENYESVKMIKMVELMNWIKMPFIHVHVYENYIAFMLNIYI